MFGKILYLSDNIGYIENKMTDDVSADLLNLHLIFENGDHKVLSEITEVKSDEIRVKFLGEFIDGHYYNGVLKKAVINTFNKRNTTYDINLFRETLEILESSDTLKNVFMDYQSKLVYPQKVEYKKTIEALNLIIDILSK